MSVPYHCANIHGYFSPSFISALSFRRGCLVLQHSTCHYIIHVIFRNSGIMHIVLNNTSATLASCFVRPYSQCLILFIPSHNRADVNCHRVYTLHTIFTYFVALCYGVHLKSPLCCDMHLFGPHINEHFSVCLPWRIWSLPMSYELGILHISFNSPTLRMFSRANWL